MKKPNLTPYQKLMRAAKRGTSLRLTVDEVFALSKNDAILMTAQEDDMALDNEDDQHPNAVAPES